MKRPYSSSEPVASRKDTDRDPAESTQWRWAPQGATRGQQVWVGLEIGVGCNGREATQPRAERREGLFEEWTAKPGTLCRMVRRGGMGLHWAESSWRSQVRCDVKAREEPSTNPMGRKRWKHSLTSHPEDWALPCFPLSLSKTVNCKVPAR